MTDVRWEGRTAVLAIVVLVVIAGLVAADLLADRGTGVGAAHLVIEGAVIVLALGAVVALVLRLWSLLRERRRLRGALVASRREAERWRGEARDLLEGLGAAIDRQFGRWGLTPAEREVAMHLLRGLSHKEVAKVRGASERTVRQQAHTLYRKAGLEGRADLAAFFLESLWFPIEEEDSSG
ncbi:MAG: helix-turn-helix transcriptional regulator [Acidobacteriota bacterium]